MVVTNQIVVACFFWACVSVTWAEGSALLSEKQENQIIDFAYTTMRATVEELEEKMDECEKSRKESFLDPTLFQSLSLTKQDLKKILLRFHFVAMAKCEGEALWAKAAVKFAQFKYIEKYYKGKNIIETENNFETICCTGSQSRLEIELNYRKISPEIRAKLERIPELQKPFNLFDITDKMGL